MLRTEKSISTPSKNVSNFFITFIFRHLTISTRPLLGGLVSQITGQRYWGESLHYSKVRGSAKHTVVRTGLEPVSTRCLTECLCRQFSHLTMFYLSKNFYKYKKKFLVAQLFFILFIISTFSFMIKFSYI